MPSLLEIQRGFRDALLNGEAAAVSVFIEADGLAPPDRIEIYRNNVMSSLVEALRDTFPAVCALVDARFFDYAAHEFVRTHPPTAPCVAEYGADFPRFLATFEPCRDLAYLPDIARLEWLLHCAAGAQILPAIGPEALTTLSADDAPSVVFKLQPSYAYLHSPWPIADIWRVNRPDAPQGRAVGLDAGATWLEVRRNGATVEFRELPPADFAFRGALASGSTFGAAIDMARQLGEDFDVNGAFMALFGEGALVEFKLHGSD